MIRRLASVYSESRAPGRDGKDEASRLINKQRRKMETEKEKKMEERKLVTR